MALETINEEVNPRRNKNLASLIDTYKEAVETFQEGDYTPKGRTYAYHTMRNLAPLVEQTLRNEGSLATTRLSGRQGLERQRLQDLSAIEQIREQSTGAMNLRELADVNTMARQKAKERADLRKIGAQREAEQALQLDRYVGTSEENRRKRQAELRKPLYQPTTDPRTGMPIEYSNINTPEQRRRSTTAGTFDQSDADFFFGKDAASNFLDLN